MNKTLRIFAIFLAIIMIAGVMCGCTQSELSRENGKYTYWATVDSRSLQTIKSYNDMLMYQELAKKTGIEIDFIHPTAGSTGSEAFQILLTSTDLPDMIEYRWKSYPGGADAAIDNKVIISLNKYLEEYAPDYYNYMEGEKSKINDGLYKTHSQTPNGNYYGFCSLNIGNYRAFSGLYIRKDLLSKWGMEVPVTIDDWSKVFAVAKKDGYKYPLTGSGYYLFDINGLNSFNGAWEVGKNYHKEGDKIIFSLDKPGYKEYVKTMADWFKKGYIDPDYITNDSDAVLGKITNGISIASYGYVGGDFGKLIPAMENSEKYPDFEIAACPFPVLKKGSTPWFQEISADADDPSIAITVACGAKNEDRYKEAISWCNELYTDEGKILKSFGVEGKTFTKEEKAANEIGADGDKYKYTYTSLIADDNDPGREEIGAHSVEAALYHFMRPGGGPGLIQHSDYLLGFYPYEAQKDAIIKWNENLKTAKEYTIPYITFTNEETERKNELWSKAYDTLNASISNIIMGKADINTYDAAVAKAKKDGFDEIRDIYQAALDRYNKTK